MLRDLIGSLRRGVRGLLVLRYWSLVQEQSGFLRRGMVIHWRRWGAYVQGHFTHTNNINITTFFVSHRPLLLLVAENVIEEEQRRLQSPCFVIHVLLVFKGEGSN